MDEGGRHAADRSPVPDTAQLQAWRTEAERILASHIRRSEDDETCAVCGNSYVPCPIRNRAVSYLVEYTWLPVPRVLPSRKPGATLGMTVREHELGAKQIA